MPIPIRVLTVVVKKRAIQQQYPGGIAGFLADRPGVPTDPYLIGVPFMSGDDVGSFLDLLRSLAFDLPACCAVGDVHLGPLDPCQGIEFYCLEPEAMFDQQWYAASCERPIAGN